MDAWGEQYGEVYPIVGGRDGKAVQWFRKQVGDDVERFREIVRNYLADGSQFITDARHSIGNLQAQWARWAVKPLAGSGAGGALRSQVIGANAEFLQRGEQRDAI